MKTFQQFQEEGSHGEKVDGKFMSYATMKAKGEKGRVQYGDRKGTPADTIAKRRQSRADAEKLMRDTSGT